MSNEPFVPDGVWIPKAIIGIVSRYAVPLYFELRKHCFKTPECFPGVRRLARLVGCSIGTVSTLTDQFDALGVIRKTHTGRPCLYRFTEGCWRLRKSRKSAHRSVHRTEERIPFGDSSDKKPEPKKPGISQRFALERRAKRVNLIKTLRRWSTLSPHLPDDERPHRLAMLDRAEASLDAWHDRLGEERQCFDLLAARARALPLDSHVMDSLRQQPAEMRAIGALLPPRVAQ